MSGFGSVSSAGVVLRDVAAFLSSDSLEHSVTAVSCRSCADFWRLAAGSALDLRPPKVVLGDLLGAVPSAPHPLPSCVGCEGCRFELREAMATVSLAAAGVDSVLAWGPGHMDSMTHPVSWEECQVCTEWVSARRWARMACEAAGVDASRWMGPSDVPPPFPSSV